ncbi:hypothetical protein Lal_00033915 [Lupinus albus]|nr:hypothetical protein Lal_00033915 [Lupinus albus]
MSPYLFTMLLDMLVEHIQEPLSQYINIEYMKCKFSKRRINLTIEVKVGDQTIPHVTKFRYIASIIQDDKKSVINVNHKI